MKVNLQNPVEDVQIQIIPLIDVIFCILTFFLLASLQFTREQAINLDLPTASTGTTTQASLQPGKRNILPVTIDAIGQTFVGKEPVNREQLQQRLQEYLQQNPEGILVLNASRSATYNDVVQTLDLLRQVGGERVSLGIIPGPEQPSTNPGAPTSPSFPINPGANPSPNATPIPQIAQNIPNLNSPPANNPIPLPANPQPQTAPQQ